MALALANNLLAQARGNGVKAMALFLERDCLMRHTVMSNWLGHGQFGKSPHLIEVTPDKKVVWTFSDHKTMRTISSIQLLDLPGDAIKGEIWH